MRDVAVLVVMLIGMVCGLGHAQTTRPAPAAFSTTLDNISDGLVAGEVSTLNDALEEGATFSGFDPESNHTADKLLLSTTGGTIVSQRAYAQVPTNLASDVATDFSKAEYVPETVRKEMIPDQSNVVKANVTATQWVMQTLEPNRKQLVGVIVVWPKEQKSGLNRRPERMRPIFILLKGEMVGDKPRIKQVVFGDPLDMK